MSRYSVPCTAPRRTVTCALHAAVPTLIELARGRVDDLEAALQCQAAQPIRGQRFEPPSIDAGDRFARMADDGAVTRRSRGRP